MLTDKDEAEYTSFEALIKTTSDFKQSTVMLCTFHGVWMAFKKDLLTLLEDCDCGKVYGNFLSLVYQFVYTNEFYLIRFYKVIFATQEEWLYKLFMHLACVFENKYQYDMSNKILTNVISVAFTKGHIKLSLKEAIEAFQIKLNNKRKYLAFYIRKSIHNCYDVNVSRGNRAIGQ